MNSILKSTLIFGAGAITGSVTTYFIIKNRLEKDFIASEEIKEEIDKIPTPDFTFALDMANDADVYVEKTIAMPNEISDHVLYRPEPGSISERIEEVKKTLKENSSDFDWPATDQQTLENEIVERDSLVMGVDGSTSEFPKGTLKNARRFDKAPYIIGEEDYYTDHDDYDKQTVRYFMDDDTFTEEEDTTPFYNADTLFGRMALDEIQGTTWYGPEDIMYVRNDTLKVDYEIVRINDSYSSFMYGPDTSDVKPIRSVRTIMEAEDEE